MSTLATTPSGWTQGPTHRSFCCCSIFPPRAAEAGSLPVVRRNSANGICMIAYDEEPYNKGRKRSKGTATPTFHTNFPHQVSPK